MNNFVPYGPVVVGPPVECKDALLFGFFLAADLTKLQELCDAVFTTPSNGVVTCTPLDSFVLLTFGTMGWVGNSALSSLGVQENQVAIQVPVEMTMGGVNTPVWFTPFEFVNNPESLTNGREVFGFAKCSGNVDVAALSEPQFLSVSAFGGNATDLVMTPRTIISVKRGLPNPLNIGWAVANLSADFFALFTQWASNGGASQIFLKQFMDAANPINACFQQILQTDFSVTLKPIWDAFAPILCDYDVTISQLDTHPVSTQLGIYTQTVHGAFRIEADLVQLANGQILWTA